MAKQGIVLKEAQGIARSVTRRRWKPLARKKRSIPDNLGSQDAYYVGNIKRVGPIYQQTFNDTYSRVAFVKVYETKHAITSADILNDRVLPVSEEHQVPLLRVLKDRGTEFKGKSEHHEYEFYLSYLA